jgi:hypothetical protein
MIYRFKATFYIVIFGLNLTLYSELANIKHDKANNNQNVIINHSLKNLAKELDLYSRKLLKEMYVIPKLIPKSNKDKIIEDFLNECSKCTHVISVNSFTTFCKGLIFSKKNDFNQAIQYIKKSIQIIETNSSLTKDEKSLVYSNMLRYIHLYQIRNHDIFSNLKKKIVFTGKIDGKLVSTKNFVANKLKVYLVAKVGKNHYIPTLQCKYNYSTDQKSFSINNVCPGDYRLTIKFKQNDGKTVVRNKEITIGEDQVIISNFEIAYIKINPNVVVKGNEFLLSWDSYLPSDNYLLNINIRRDGIKEYFNVSNFFSSNINKFNLSKSKFKIKSRQKYDILMFVHKNNENKKEVYHAKQSVVIPDP